MNPLLHTWFHGTRSRYSYKWSITSREPKQQGINNSHHFGPLAQAEDVPAYLMHSYFVRFKKRHDSGCIFKTEGTFLRFYTFYAPMSTFIHISTIKITRCPVKVIKSKLNFTQVKNNMTWEILFSSASLFYLILSYKSMSLSAVW